MPQEDIPLPDLIDRFNLLVRLLRELQDERCGMCGVKTRLVIDHDHGSGLVRGLLCSGCNTCEGRHDWCDFPNDCETCQWRLHPTVTWIGWTTQWISSQALALPTLYGLPDEWTTGRGMVAHHRAGMDRVAAAFDSMLSPADARRERLANEDARG